MRHTLQYTCDALEWLVIAGRCPQSLCDRLQLELDTLFLRCGRHLYQAQALGAWQFLAVLPFKSISTFALWKFLYMLHAGDYNQATVISSNVRNLLSTQEVRQQFEERLCLLGVEESYYLLNTFANMIMARPDVDFEFIRFATINLLEIGFVGEATRESCSKSAAVLLSNVTSRWPHLLSNILQASASEVEKMGGLAALLFRELPLHMWRPNEQDLALIAEWLLTHPITSVQSHIARLILASLNWDFSR